MVLATVTNEARMRNANGTRRRAKWWAGAALCLTVVAGCAPRDAGSAGQPAEAVRREQLAGGFQAFDERRYDDAIQSAERVLAEDSSGPGSAEAMYLEARVHEQRAKESSTTGEARDHLRE